MKHFLSISILLLLCLTSCTDDKAVLTILDRAEAMMGEHSDSAYLWLCKADSAIADQSKKTQMRHLMLKAEATNKLFLQMPSDTLFQEVVDYYDRHGTPNQQLKAHYLLGCIYRDMKEAPQAIQCYYDAVEKADTLSSDCDYNTLFRVYGQMADVFNRQIMPDEELEALKKFSKYALKAGQRYEYVHGIDLMPRAYNQKGDTAMILSVEQQTYDLYMKYGYPKAAAAAYTISMYVYIDRKDFKKAHELMQLFESKSGLFDSKGNIKRGREHYYHCKGLYYLGINQLDSAEYYFKKQLPYGYSFDGYRGLMEVAQRKGDSQSVLSYSKRYEASFDTLVTNIHAEATRQVVGMYDYTRNQKITMQKTIESERRKNLLLLLGTTAFFIVAFLLYLYFRAKQEERRKVHLLTRKIADTSALHEKTKEKLAEQQSQMKEFQTMYGNLKQKENLDALMQSPIIQTLKARLNPQNHHLTTDREWEELFILFSQNLPIFHARIIANRDLSTHERHVAVLTFLGFQPVDIAHLLNLSEQHIGNVRRSANKKLFSDGSARTFSDNLCHI